MWNPKPPTIDGVTVGYAWLFLHPTHPIHVLTSREAVDGIAFGLAAFPRKVWFNPEACATSLVVARDS